MQQRRLKGCLAALSVAVALTGCASPPPPSPGGPSEPWVNIDPARHGNLAGAQELIRAAYDKLTVAQQDNNYRLGGNADRAKDLLRQASQELRYAANAANSR